MCGIVGFIDYTGNSDKIILQNMTDALKHRGPDDFGVEITFQNNIKIGLGHTRLSIIDLSKNGHQPMQYENLFIAFNGEIYNFLEIKRELTTLGHTFKSDSDTEVILHSFNEWGIACIEKFIGMFAIAIIDRKENKLYLIRDRAGIKPIYFYQNNDVFLFSSELKSFHKHPKFEKSINFSTLKQYFDFGYIPGNNCIFQNTYKVESGTYMIFDFISKKYNLYKYWNIHEYYEKPKLKIDYKVAKSNITQIIESSLEYRMISDVPVGVFLSGGYDSVGIASILQSNRNSKIRTYTIGFQSQHNESEYAKNISNYIGTEHTELICTGKDASEIVNLLPEIYDEPFADPSSIPMLLVSKLAKNEVTVVLSGDGGDEIFAGYSLHKNLLTNINYLSLLPNKFHKLFYKLSKKPISNQLKYKFNVISNQLKYKYLLPNQIYSSYYKFTDYSKDDLFKFDWVDLPNTYNYDFKKYNNPIDIALGIDYEIYLQGVLTKVDRASMYFGIETREPLLDHRLVEYVAQLPMEFKINKNNQKIIFKDIVSDYIPNNLLFKKKNGFTPPIFDWLKNELKDYLEESFKNLYKIQFFNPEYLKVIKNKFYNNQLQDKSIIWKLIQFEQWYKKWME